MKNRNLIKIKDLNVVFKNGNNYFHVLKDINLKVGRGQILGIVGESGSGKTTLGKSLLGLLNKTSGNIYVDGNIIPKKELKVVNKKNIWLYKKGQMIFQNPLSSLPENKKVKSILLEGLKNFNISEEILKDRENKSKIILDIDKLLELTNSNNFGDEFFKFFTNHKEIQKIILEYEEARTKNFDLKYLNESFSLKEEYSKSKVNLIKLKRKVERQELLKEKLNFSDLLSETKKIYKNEIKEKSKRNLIGLRLTEALTKSLMELEDNLSNYNFLTVNEKTKLKDLLEKKDYSKIKILLEKKITLKINARDEKFELNKFLFENLGTYIIGIINLSQNSTTKSIREFLIEVLTKIWLSIKDIIFEIYDIKILLKDTPNLSKDFTKKYKEILSLIRDMLEMYYYIRNEVIENITKINGDKVKHIFKILSEFNLKILEIKDGISNFEYKFSKELLNNYISNRYENIEKELKKYDNVKIKIEKKYINLRKTLFSKFVHLLEEFCFKKKYSKDIDKNLIEHNNYFREIEKKGETKYPINPVLKYSKEEKAKIVNDKLEEILKLMSLNVVALNKYPKQFSGGQQQRIGIARALLTNPEFIVADEPISALDVSVQSQVVNLFKDLHKKLGLTILFIAHDLEMVKYISNKIIIMYRGKILEYGDTNTIYNNAIHPYTRALIKAIPKLGSTKKLETSDYSVKIHNYNKYTKLDYYEIEDDHYVYGEENEVNDWVKKYSKG